MFVEVRLGIHCWWGFQSEDERKDQDILPMCQPGLFRLLKIVTTRTETAATKCHANISLSENDIKVSIMPPKSPTAQFVWVAMCVEYKFTASPMMSGLVDFHPPFTVCHARSRLASVAFPSCTTRTSPFITSTLCSATLNSLVKMVYKGYPPEPPLHCSDWWLVDLLVSKLVGTLRGETRFLCFLSSLFSHR